MQHLFSEFKPASAAEWKAQLAKDLKGESFDDLVWQNENGFNIQPFYTAEDLHQHYEPAFTHANWDIAVNGKSSDAKTLNQQLLKNLAGGATAIAVHADGLDLDIALKDVQLNYIQSAFFVSAGNVNALKQYLEKNYNPATLQCSIIPAKFSSQQDLDDWSHAITAFKNHSTIKTLAVDALPIHNGNCLAYYETAVALCMLLEYLNTVDKNNLTTAPFVIKTGASSDYFVQMAKLRALRRLWQLLKAEYGIENDLYMIIETSSTNKSISDSYNNLLRSTVEAMAAVAGGCNELIVTEFDMLFPNNAALSGRMAINQQLILKDESYLDKMADVACGSYYIETLTDAIAAKALEVMKQIEAQGGYFKNLESINNTIQQQAKAREQHIAEQKQIVIGVNKFRNDKEQINITAKDIERLQQLPLHNPVLNFELQHYFKQHA